MSDHVCGCGGHHHHDHDHGDHHGHHHGHGHKCCGKHKHHNSTLTKEQVLYTLTVGNYAPMTKLVMRSSKSSHFEMSALSPFYLIPGFEDMENVKQVAYLLEELEEMDYITLDYDIPLSNYPYQEYYDSQVFQSCVAMMEESKGKEGYVFDKADLELGSIALTDKGLEAVKTLVATYDHHEE